MAGKLAAAAGITGGGLLLHFLGAISHRTYLNALSLDAGLFPRTTDWTMITGYYMAMDRFTAMFSLFVANAWIALVGMFSMALYMFCVQQAGRFTEQKLKGTAPPRWLKGWPAELASVLMIASIVCLSIPLTLALAILLMVGPAALAETAGQQAAQRDLAQFRKGCAAALATAKCMEIHKNGTLVARGFLIDSTESHIAIFDVDQQRAHAMERAGTELLGEVLPAKDKSKDVQSRP